MSDLFHVLKFGHYIAWNKLHQIVVLYNMDQRSIWIKYQYMNQVLIWKKIPVGILHLHLENFVMNAKVKLSMTTHNFTAVGAQSAINISNRFPIL